MDNVNIDRESFRRVVGAPIWHRQAGWQPTLNLYVDGNGRVDVFAGVQGDTETHPGLIRSGQLLAFPLGEGFDIDLFLVEHAELLGRLANEATDARSRDELAALLRNALSCLT